MSRLGSKENPLRLNVHEQSKAMHLLALCEEKGWKVIIAMNSTEPEDLRDLDRKLNPQTVEYIRPKFGRNEPCPCGSGKKYKKCHADSDFGLTENSGNLENSPA